MPSKLIYARFSSLVDLTMQATANEQSESVSQTTTTVEGLSAAPSERNLNLGDAELGLRELHSGHSSPSSSTANNTSNGGTSATAKLLNNANANAATITLRGLVETFAESDVAAEIRAEGETMRNEAVRNDNHVAAVPAPDEGAADAAASNGAVNNSLPDVVQETTLLRGRKRASWATQFRILSGRAFKNLYRDPALLAAHYSSAIVLAVICGLFYHNIT